MNIKETVEEFVGRELSGDIDFANVIDNQPLFFRLINKIEQEFEIAIDVTDVYWFDFDVLDDFVNYVKENTL